MVVDLNFDDIFDFSCLNLTLPKCKEQNLTLDFYDSDEDFKTLYLEPSPILPFAESKLHNVPIKEWRCLAAEKKGSKTVYEITFDTKDSSIKYSPGDTIGVVPHNNEHDVNEVLQCLNVTLDADRLYRINVNKDIKTKVPSHIPVQSTLRHAFTHCVDLRSVVKKLFLLELSKYTEKVKEKRALEFLCSKEGSAFYNHHVLNKQLSFIQILNIFHSCKPPIGVILAHSSRLLPRPYSIANSMKYNEDILKICFSVKILDNKKKGLTTGWLENLFTSESNIENSLKKLNINESKVEKEIPIYLRKNMGFKLPDYKENLLLICAGTGVAPFIGFLEERQFLKENNNDLEIGETWLYYGCRNPEDYLYKKEIQKFEDRKVLTKFCMAYSRIDNGGIKYVQDALRQDEETIGEFIADGAVVMVCGDLVTMATQVRNTIVRALMVHFATNQKEAEDMLVLMEKEKKYLTDVWS